jgi:hypothetical protein
MGRKKTGRVQKHNERMRKKLDERMAVPGMTPVGVEGVLPVQSTANNPTDDFGAYAQIPLAGHMPQVSCCFVCYCGANSPPECQDIPIDLDNVKEF